MTKLKHCLVTGGAGFIGSHLVQRLLKEGYHVTVIDDLSEGKWENIPDHPMLVKHEGSILDDMSGLVAGQDVIFHLAALPRVQRSMKYPLETHRVNVDGTLNVLLAAKEQGIKKFVFASSSSIYGEQDHLPFTEEMKPNPMSPYGLHKLIGEQYCLLFNKLWGLEVICLRYFSVYGPGMSPNGDYALLIPKFIKYMSNDKAPIINGDGEQTRDFTFISDVVEATLMAAQSDISGGVFNIGFGKGTSVNKVAGMINQLMDKHIAPIHGNPVVEPRSTLASRTKAHTILGWEPKVSFEEGLSLIIHGASN